MTALIKLIERVRFLFLFFVLMIFCFTKALDAQFGFWGLADIILFILIVYSLVIIGDKSSRLLTALMFLIVIEGFLLICSFLLSFPIIGVIKAFFTMLYFILMTAVCLRYTLADKTIDITSLFGSLSSYLFIGLAFAYLYLWIVLLEPNAFTGISYENDVIYYSFITLTTVGFGDIVPKVPITQTLSWMESFIGQAYLAIIMAQLVGRYIADKLRDQL